MNYFKILVAIFLLFSVISCHDENEIVIPIDLITETDMVNVLTDVCKVEARFQRRLTIKSLNNVELVAHNYTIVFNKHNISLQQFKDSYSYYEANPQKMQELFEQVIIHLTEEESQLKDTEGEKNNI